MVRRTLLTLCLLGCFALPAVAGEVGLAFGGVWLSGAPGVFSAPIEILGSSFELAGPDGLFPISGSGTSSDPFLYDTQFHLLTSGSSFNCYECAVLTLAGSGFYQTPNQFIFQASGDAVLNPGFYSQAGIVAQPYLYALAYVNLELDYFPDGDAGNWRPTGLVKIEPHDQNLPVPEPSTLILAAPVVAALLRKKWRS